MPFIIENDVLSKVAFGDKIMYVTTPRGKIDIFPSTEDLCYAAINFVQDTPRRVFSLCLVYLNRETNYLMYYLQESDWPLVEKWMRNTGFLIKRCKNRGVTLINTSNITSVEPEYAYLIRINWTDGSFSYLSDYEADAFRKVLEPWISKKEEE